MSVHRLRSSLLLLSILASANKSNATSDANRDSGIASFMHHGHPAQARSVNLIAATGGCPTHASTYKQTFHCGNGPIVTDTCRIQTKLALFAGLNGSIRETITITGKDDATVSRETITLSPGLAEVASSMMKYALYVGMEEARLMPREIISNLIASPATLYFASIDLSNNKGFNTPLKGTVVGNVVTKMTSSDPFPCSYFTTPENRPWLSPMAAPGCAASGYNR